jgi:NAD(P)-dependent dehydrogenase (short-subunit alcohol dehydrogenase family)
MASLEGKVALVTGGAGGIGRATCRALAGAGALLVVADVDEEGGREVADALDGEFVRCDVASFADNLAVVQAAQDLHGRLDLVHLNAGVATGCGVGEDFDPDLYRRAMGVNVDGVVFGTHAALTALKPGGAIVATASLAGLAAVPQDPIYAANKHAVVGLTRALGPLLADAGVRFNAICPGFSESNIIAAELRSYLEASGIPIMAPERAAEAVIELFEGEMTGECWFVQYGRPAEAFAFRGIPGVRAPSV